MDFINRFAILRAYKYNANTIKGMREERERKRESEKAGRRRVAEDAAPTMLCGSQRRSRTREKERTSEARVVGRAREKRRATNDAERG